MKETLECNLCEEPGTFDKAKEVLLVPCHVKKFQTDQFTVWRCNNCGSLHSKEVVDLPKYYADYPFKNHSLDFHTKVAYRNRLHMLKAQGINESHRILDYGCGKGLYVDFLRKEGFSQTTGYDPYSVKFSDNKVLEEQYDVVVSHDVIEHVENPREYLEILLGLTKQSGLLVLGTPNADEITLKTDSRYTIELSQPYHRHIFSEKALLSMTRSLGLKPLHTHRRFYYDTLVPGVNVRFMWNYIQKRGGLIDVAVEPLDWKTVLGSPSLIFYALFGYFFRMPGNILVTFQNTGSGRSAVDTQQKEVANG